MNMRMLKVWIATVTMMIVGSTATAQTNTFPASGNAGVGTVSPAYLLHVKGASDVPMAVESTGNNTYLSLQNAAGGSSISATGSTLYLGETGWIYFRSGPGWDVRMFVNPDGNVGIGRAPTARLHVKAAYNDMNSGLMLECSDTGDVERYNLRLFPYVVGHSMVGYKFQTKSAEGGTNVPLAFDNAGNVGIGTASPSHKLSVNGTIKTKEVIVETAGWADDVFSLDYRLPALSAIREHIDAHGTLPGVPSADEVAANGVSVGEMQVTLLRKIEELTLHIIQQDQRIRELEDKVSSKSADR